jgi:hypothetical protein
MRITYLTPKVIQGGILTAESRQAYPTATDQTGSASE